MTAFRAARWLPSLLLLAGCAPQDREFSLAVTTEEPAPAIAETLRRTFGNAGFELSVTTAAGSDATFAAIRDGTLDLAIVEEPEQAEAGIVTVAPLYPSVLHVLYRGAETPADFASLVRGASIYAGPAAGTAHNLLQQLAADAGLTRDDYQLLDNPWTRVPDIFFVLGGLLSKDSLAELDDYRLYDFQAADDVPGGSVADGIALRHHRLRPFLLPRGIYPNLADEAVLTLSIRSVLVGSARIDSELAYDISSNIFSSAQEIALNYPLVTRELDENLVSAGLMLPLHAGTRRFLDRDAPGFLERYVDVLALYFTIFITVVSGGIAIYRYRSQVRKDRVDSYFQQLLDVRTAAAAGHDPGECRQRILAVQHEVMELLIDERVAADASLVAFVSLSNQLLAELPATR